MDEDGQDYQPPYFPPPQFEQGGQYQFHSTTNNGDGTFSQQAIMINENGEQILEDENGQPTSGTRILVGNSDNYIVTQDGLALQAVDGQQVIMMNEVKLKYIFWALARVVEWMRKIFYPHFFLYFFKLPQKVGRGGKATPIHLFYKPDCILQKIKFSKNCKFRNFED